jgi:hypothetical protein
LENVRNGGLEMAAADFVIGDTDYYFKESFPEFIISAPGFYKFC